MADFYRVNGNVGAPGDGKGFVSTAIGASFIGKTPLAIAGYIAASGGTAQDLRYESNVNYALPAILSTLESNVTVLAYQVENGSGGNISLLLEGANHLTASDIQGIVRGNSPYGNNAVDATGSVFVNRGFKLSYV
jgi:hypothetical protein